MNDVVSVFNFYEHPVRIHKIEDAPVFCLADVCKALGVTNSRSRVAHLFKKGVYYIDTPTAGGSQSMVYVSEQNLYKVALQSRTKAAEPFVEWVTGEVLPAIRRDGGYMVSKPDETPEELMARALLVANATMERQQRRLQELENTVTEMTPHAEYSKKVLEAENLHTVNSIGVHLGISAQRLNKFLMAQGWIYKQGRTYCPAAKIREQGLCDYHIVPYNAHGEIHTREHLKWTEKGRKAVIDLWNNTNGVLPLAM